jgi:hypothetical protein
MILIGFTQGGSGRIFRTDIVYLAFSISTKLAQLRVPGRSLNRCHLKAELLRATPSLPDQARDSYQPEEKVSCPQVG